MGDATACARVLVHALVDAGITEVVLCPGSRSAPLAYALHDADAAGVLRLHVRIDERTAGFLALGLAKVSGHPVAVVTTSGTAAANLYPAVLEAAHSHLPLVLVTADRPAALRGSGANQTTDQTRLYGVHVRAYGELDDTAGTTASWRAQVGRLLVAATGQRSRLPGPVHVNVALSDPLVPHAVSAVPAVSPIPAGDGDGAVGGWPPTSPGAPDAVSVVAPMVVPELAVTRLMPGPRTVLVAGDQAPAAGRALSDLAAAAGLPLLAEPSSNARHSPVAIGTYRLLVGGPLAAEIERVIVFGHPTLSRPVQRLLASPGVEVVVVSPYADWNDPGHNARRIVDAVRFEPATGAAAEVDRRWLSRWRSADAAVRAGVDDLLARQPALTGPALALRLWESLGPADTLVVGSSHPVRDLDLAPARPRAPAVYANRGLAGIDGTVSTALGVALGGDRPTHALMGDLTFLHDCTGLIVPPGEPRPDLRIVVANDDGGSIFSTLEYGTPALSGSFERLFATPTRTDLTALAEAMHARSQRVTTIAALDAILARPPHGVEVVEAVLDRAGRRELEAALTGLAAIGAPPR